MSLKTLSNFVAPQNLLPISPNIKTRHKTKIPFPVLQCDLLYGRPHSQLSKYLGTNHSKNLCPTCHGIHSYCKHFVLRFNFCFAYEGYFRKAFKWPLLSLERVTLCRHWNLAFVTSIHMLIMLIFFQQLFINKRCPKHPVALHDISVQSCNDVSNQVIF